MLMLRNVIRRPTSQTQLSLSIARSTAKCFASGNTGAKDDEDVIEARKWLSRLDADTVRRNAVCDISFSRSSGPGGQNVNKVSSKATLRIPTSSLLPLLPNLLHRSILGSRYHAAKSADIVIQADDSRKQNDNVNSCFRKLHELILDAAKDTVPGETSAEQAKHVKDLQKAEAAGRRRMKEFQSKKKTSRRGGKGDGY